MNHECPDCREREEMDDAFLRYDGRVEVDEELALAALLRDSRVFANSADYTFNGKPTGHTVILFVGCNDLFAWGCADAEDLPYSEIPALYRAWREDPEYGVERWCCFRRNLQPQGPVKRDWVESGKWDAALEALPPNPDAARHAPRPESPEPWPAS